jgi:hypothetical protein
LIANEIGKCVSTYECSLQQIETGLREKRCFTYLIARRRNASHGKDLSIELSKGTIKTYYLFLSTRAPALAMKELLEESSSYEENFEKLKDTGFLVVRNDKPLLNQFNSGSLLLNWIGVERVISEIKQRSSN